MKMCVTIGIASNQIKHEKLIVGIMLYEANIDSDIFLGQYIPLDLQVILKLETRTFKLL